MCPSDPALLPTVSLVMTPWMRVPFSTHTCTGEQDTVLTTRHSSPHTHNAMCRNHNKHLAQFTCHLPLHHPSQHTFVSPGEMYLYGPLSSSSG